MYIGQDLQVAYPNYTNIDDISGSFNGVTTSFALTVGGVAPVPNPARSNQCIISVGGVLQRPDDTGSEGFRLSGGNIIFSSAPSTGEDFFGVILAGSDYVNVGADFPSGTAAVPSITFDSDLDTGIYNPAANQLGVACGGTNAVTITSASSTFSGNINDSKGDVRDIPQNSQTGAYILATADVGKHISITTGGVTVPAGVFVVGDAISIYNNSSGNQTITQGVSATLRQAGTANTGNRTLAQYGLATVLCVASNTFVISGAGLT